MRSSAHSKTVCALFLWRLTCRVFIFGSFTQNEKQKQQITRDQIQMRRWIAARSTQHRRTLNYMYSECTHTCQPNRWYGYGRSLHPIHNCMSDRTVCVYRTVPHTHTSASTRSRRTRRLMAFGRTSHQHMNGVTASAEPTMIFYYFITRDLSMRGARLRVCSIIFLCSGTRFYYSISHEPLRIGFRAWIWWKTAARFCRSEKPCKTQRNYTEVSGISSTIVVGWEWLHDEDGKEYDDDVRV